MPVQWCVFRVQGSLNWRFLKVITQARSVPLTIPLSQRALVCIGVFNSFSKQSPPTICTLGVRIVHGNTLIYGVVLNWMLQSAFTLFQFWSVG
jgi:hypothetical protein